MDIPQQQQQQQIEQHLQQVQLVLLTRASALHESVKKGLICKRGASTRADILIRRRERNDPLDKKCTAQVLNGQPHGLGCRQTKQNLCIA